MEGAGPEVGPGELRDHRSARRFVGHLWASEVAEAFPWRTYRAYRFKKPSNIDVLE